MKTDLDLGLNIQAHLLDIGVETPINYDRQRVDKIYAIAEIEHHTRKIWEILGLDLQDDSLKDTPNRIAKMYINDFFVGLDYVNFPKCTTIENKMDAGIVVERGVKIMSICEHHGVTIDGTACIAYIPKNKVIGLSKINRIADFFSRRPQVQERLTNQIWHTLSYILDTDDVAVYIDAVHFCVRSPGVEDANSSTFTNKLGGSFKTDSACRAEFMSIAKGN